MRNKSNLIFNKGYIPEVFKNSDNPKNIFWHSSNHFWTSGCIEKLINSR